MLALRKLFNQTQIRLWKSYATGSKLIDVTHSDTGISTISMSRAPVNSLNAELLDELMVSLIDVQQQGSKGLILTSSLPKVFSAGLDIMEMYDRDVQQMTEFWKALQNAWLTLYSLEIPVAAAINGASPAGGCVLALSCEYRVFVDGKHSIGLNETKLGIVAPPWFKDLYIGTIGHRKAELALLRGSLFSPKEALEIGLVDELAVDKADAVKKCENYISCFEKIPREGRVATKLSLRQENLNWLKQNREADLKNFITFVKSSKAQAALKAYVGLLKQKQ